MREEYSFSIEDFKFVSTKFTDFVVSSKVIPLFNKYKDVLVDDYWDLLENPFELLMNMVYPYFFSIFDPEDSFVGYMYLSDWRFQGSVCSFHIVIDEKYQGKHVKEMANKVSEELFRKFNLRRIDCIIPIFNKKVAAFAKYILKCEFEGIMKSYSIKNGISIDYLRYARIRR